MALIVETGGGVRNANTYITPAFVTTYLTERARQEENGWDAADTATKEAAVIKSTQYLDQRWGQQLKGTKCYYFDGVAATAAINLPTNPSASQTVRIGEFTYTFVAGPLSENIPNQVLIGGTAADSVANLLGAIQQDSDLSNVGYSQTTVANSSVTALLDDTVLTEIDLVSSQSGDAGNYITLSSTVTGGSLIAFAGGADAAAQTLEFPRLGLVDRNGRLVIGVPLKVRQATAEYAVRAVLGTPLAPDLSVDDSGMQITSFKEKIGPLEEQTQFLPGGQVAVSRSYPGADLLMQDFISAGGTALRA